MKYVKMLALAAVAAGALMAFIGAGTASASVLCSTTANPCPTTQKWPNSLLKFSLTKETSAKLKEPGAEGATLDTCTGSNVEGTLTNGSSTATAAGPVSSLTWSGCSSTTDTTGLGSLEVHQIAGTSNGTVTVAAGTVFKVTVNVFGITCTYEAPEGTDLGVLTEGNPAVFHAEAVVGSLSFLCPTKAEWFATYTLTSPSGTTLSVSSS